MSAKKAPTAACSGGGGRLSRLTVRGSVTLHRIRATKQHRKPSFGKLIPHLSVAPLQKPFCYYNLLKGALDGTSRSRIPN